MPRIARVKAPRTLRLLLVTGLLALVPAAAHAQSAGDEQYSDPLGGQTATGSSTTPATPKRQTTPAAPAATPAPSSSAAPTTTAAAPATTAPTPAARAKATAAPTGQLPRTGLDSWAVAALGGALLLLGIGLRLRTADARP